MKRAPISTSALADTAECGTLLDIRYASAGEQFIVSPRGRAAPLLQWSQPASALVVWFGLKMPRPRPASSPDASASAAYERWTDYERAASTEREFTTPALTGSWRSLGRAVAIGYRSDKFSDKGKPVAYDHAFTSKVRVYALGASKQLYVLRGGSLRLTRRGIEG